MIRLVILLLFVILLWLLIASGFERRKKIVLGLLLIGIAIAGFFFEGYDKREHTNLLEQSQVQNCGVSAKHSYRSNFDLQICIQNLAETGVVSRLKVAVIAKVCPEDEPQKCLEIERVIRDIPVKIRPKSQVSVLQNLSFKQVSPSTNDVQWSVDILSTKATRQ